MLAGLEDIDWASLGHAYGSAEGVPNLLRALASPNAEEQQEAIFELFGNIWHQGTVYEATAPAVPFLIELAGCPQVEDRGEILWLLASIARGNSYLDVHQFMDGMQTESAKPDFHEQLTKELRWVENANTAVEAGVPMYEALLGDDDPKVRSIAAFLLGVLFAEPSLKKVESQLEVEQDPWVKGHLGWVADRLGSDGSFDYLKNAVLDSSEPLPVRFMAFVAMLETRNEEVIKTTLASTPALLSLKGIPENYPWFDDESVVSYLSWGLSQYPNLRRDWLLGLLNDPRADVRLQAVDAIGEYCRERRRGPLEMIPSLVKHLADGSGSVREAIVKLLSQLGEAAESALGPLSQMKAHPKFAVQKAASDAEAAILNRKNQHTVERWRKLHPPHGVTKGPLAKMRVPGLVKTLVGEDMPKDQRQMDVRAGAASTLGEMGPLASASIPALTKTLEWPDQWVRVCCAIALWKVSGNAEAVLPTLIEELRGRPVGILAADCLAEMGPAAAPARAALERIVNAETRVVELGIADNWIDMDEAFQAQCRRALDAITED